MPGILDQVRADAARAASCLPHVKVVREAASEAAEKFRNVASRPPEWDSDLQFSDCTDRTADWVFAVDSLNFCFWPDEGRKRWTVEYAGERRRGYFALTCALKKALLAGELDLDMRSLATISSEKLAAILDGDGDIPMIVERASILRDNARVLLENYGGSFPKLVESCRGSAVAFVHALYVNFPTFRDESELGGRKFVFMKRAQILVSDLWGAFQGQGLGRFEDLDQLTAFADYRIPQILRSMGILVYSDGLATAVDSGRLLPAGSEEEISIRGCTIHAVETIVDELKKRGVSSSTAFGLDWMLWNESHRPEHNLKPYHLTRTIFY